MFELYLRHYGRDGVLKTAAIQPLWARFTTHVYEDKPLVFGLDLAHPAAGDLEEFDILEVMMRERALGWVDFSRVFVGILRGIDRVTDENLVTQMTFTCPEEKTILSWRSVFWPAGVDNRSSFGTVAAETAMKTLVTYNCTASATVAAGRLREGNLATAAPTGMGFAVSVASDGGDGEKVSFTCPGKVVLEVLAAIARQGGGDFSFAWAGGSLGGSHAWTFDFAVGQLGEDKSSGTARVLFALQNGTLLNPRLQVRGAKATVAISAGQDQGVNRQVSEVEGVDYAGDYDIEVFVDARQASTEAMRVFRGQERLEALRAQLDLTFGVVQTSEVFFAPMAITGKKTYRAGDLVLVEYGGQEVRKILGVFVDWKPEGVGIALETEVVSG